MNEFIESIYFSPSSETTVDFIDIDRIDNREYSLVKDRFHIMAYNESDDIEFMNNYGLGCDVQILLLANEIDNSHFDFTDIRNLPDFLDKDGELIRKYCGDVNTRIRSF